MVLPWFDGKRTLAPYLAEVRLAPHLGPRRGGTTSSQPLSKQQDTVKLIAALQWRFDQTEPEELARAQLNKMW